MRAMQGRPVLLQRYPNGASGKSFFQKRVPKIAPGVAADGGRQHPEWHHVGRARRGRPGARHLGGQPRLHRLPRLARARRRPGARGRAAHRPRPLAGRHLRDGPGGGARGPAAARRARPGAMPKTTGNRGIHVYVRLQPRWTSYQVRSAAVAVARELERRRPELLTSAWWKEERGQRVFIDYNQNAPHKTIFGAWSVRAATGAQVSTPFAWDELDDDRPGRADDRDGARRACGRRRPLGGDDDAPQSLEPLLAMYERDTADGPAGRRVAAGLPEDAQRAAACGAEPRPQGRDRRWSSR